jgi:hypothetical protein
LYGECGIGDTFGGAYFEMVLAMLATSAVKPCEGGILILAIDSLYLKAKPGCNLLALDFELSTLNFQL